VPIQYADPTVSRVKFEREIAEYNAMRAEYQSRGWFLTHAEFPNVSVVLAAPQLKPPAIILGVEFDYANYDAAPPSVRLVNPITGVAFKHRELPTPLNRALPPQEVPVPGLGGQRVRVEGVQPYMQAHSPDDIPFLCVAGVREYHEHPAHSGDAWELHRAAGAGRLVRLLEIIHRYGIAPITGYAVQLVPQIGLDLGQAPA